MPTYRCGRHEFGQNFLTDQRTIATIVGLVDHTDGPIIEIGPGSGALTLPLQALRRPITAIEIDDRQVRSLRGRVGEHTAIVTGDFLRYRLPHHPHVIVGNLPFDRTTAMLRRILHSTEWTDAILMTQWEVARRRAGVGGATMMTAQWWPWYEFTLAGRVSAAAFTPRPGVDAGLLTVRRRPEALVARHDRTRYRAFVHAVFTGRGRGLSQIVTGVAGPAAKPDVQRWLARQRFRGTPLPRDLSAAHWAELFTLVGRGFGERGRDR